VCVQLVGGAIHERQLLDFPGRGLRSPCMVVTCRTWKNDGRKRSYFSMLYETVLRSFISVAVYGQIRRKTEENGDYIRPPYTPGINHRFLLRISPYTTRRCTIVNDRACSTWVPYRFRSSYSPVAPAREVSQRLTERARFVRCITFRTGLTEPEISFSLERLSMKYAEYKIIQNDHSLMKNFQDEFFQSV
jgi:hypothetical protein